MHKSTELKRQTCPLQFIKGMTLDQYMAQYTNQQQFQSQSEMQQTDQNLYDSSLHGQRRGLISKNQHLRIDQIDQESVQDSIQYKKPQYAQATPVFQQQQVYTKETIEQRSSMEIDLRSKITHISINGPPNLKQYSQQKNNFKIKRASLSPIKRKSNQPIQNTSITLYGSKFGQSSKKQPIKMPDLFTFYGKLNLDVDQRRQGKKVKSKVSQITHKFKKKSQLQLRQLMMFQSRIKNKYIQDKVQTEMLVWGVKDKLTDRKPKFP